MTQCADVSAYAHRVLSLVSVYGVAPPFTRVPRGGLHTERRLQTYGAALQIVASGREAVNSAWRAVQLEEFGQRLGLRVCQAARDGEPMMNR